MIVSELPPAAVMERAVRERDAGFEGVFWFGVATTGVLCRPGCPARTPNTENLRWFASLDAGLEAGFRPCKRCRPTERHGATPPWLRSLLAAVEQDPTRRWTDAELDAGGFPPVRVRRWFRAQHGTTFHAWLRARRLGASLDGLRDGAGVVQAGFDAGYESVSGFRDAFARCFTRTPSAARGLRRLELRTLSTPLGTMFAAADEDALHLLEFHDRRALARQARTLAQRLDAVFVPGDNALLRATEEQLEAWFAGTRTAFDLPLALAGSDWERSVWRALQAIPYGETRSYAEVAAALGRPGASRAVGTANGRNRLAIVVPCHRVLRADGSLSGYGGGLWRKRKLLAHERAVLSRCAAPSN